MTDDPRPLLALATTDPLSPQTFSGISARLFAALQALGHDALPVATRSLRWYDALTGAISPGALLAGRGRRDRPLVRPDWYWSRAGFARFCKRLDTRLATVAPQGGTILQIGTHVRTTRPGFRSFCLTDATVVQAVEASEFAVSRASARTVAEATECQREVFATCERVFTLSRWAAASVTGDYGIDPQRVVVVGAGANVTDPLPRDPGAPLVLFVGRDWDQKGGPLIAAAFARLHEAVPGARLAIVGCTPAITQPGVEIVGPIDRSDPEQDAHLRRLYARATCLALASRFDAFPNVILEAAACGVPTVATDGQSRAEVVRDGETGLLVATGDTARFAEALTRLATEPGLADHLGTAARAMVEREFTWEHVARTIAEYL